MQLGYSITGISNSFCVLLVVSQVYCSADIAAVRVLCYYIRRAVPATILCHLDRSTYILYLKDEHSLFSTESRCNPCEFTAFLCNGI